MTTAELAPARFNVMGVSEDRTTCDCCGKQNLKRTVCLRRESDGEDLFYGVNCAADALKLRKKYSAKDAAKLVNHARIVLAERDRTAEQRARTLALAERQALTSGMPQTAYRYCCRDGRVHFGFMASTLFDARNDIRLHPIN